MDEPAFATRESIAGLRGGRGFEVAAPGLWCSGDLSGLARHVVAVVGTRAATPYGRRLAYEFGAQLGSAGCCIISGLALGIDAAAHEGAVNVRAPTVGVLGSGHRHFFPERNRGLAERMLEAGGAVVSPFDPGQPAFPGQFLQRNGIVAALADAVVVIEAPARSGALNTASWAAGHVPVLAVPGDVDRKHVQGCLALIRDGATLARSAADVLEVLGRLPLSLEPAPAPLSQRQNPIEHSLLQALEAGVTEFDELVALAAVPASAALAALTLLEFEGAIESRGPSRFARVGAASSGEMHAE
jgi:DNA processing protein